jgi:BMFP domain-containing protein YqiC
MAISSEPEKYNWLQFAVAPGKPLQRKPESQDSSHTQVKAFFHTQGQTLRTLYHVDDPLARLATQIMRESRETVREVELQLRALQQYVDLRQPDVLRTLDLSLQQDLLMKARKINELETHWQAIAKLQSKQMAESPAAQLQSKTNLDQSPQLYAQLEHTMKLMNALSFQINPTFNPRP